MNISNFQQKSWQRLFSDLPRLFESKSFTFNDVTVSFKPTNANNFINNISAIHQRLAYDISYVSTDSAAISTQGCIKDLTLIDLPIFSDDGFVVDGTKYGVVSKLVPASGWYLGYTQFSGVSCPSLALQRGSSKCLEFVYNIKKKQVLVRGISSKGDAPKTMTLGRFLRVMSGACTEQELSADFEDCQFILEELNDQSAQNCSIEECAHDMLTIMRTRNIDTHVDKVKYAQDYIYKNFLHIGPERLVRLKRMLHYARAKGLTLYEAVKLPNGTVIPSQTTLTLAHVKALEKASVPCISVIKDDSVYRLYAYQNNNKEIIYDEIVAVLRAFDAFCAGIGEPDVQDAYYNKVLSSVYKEFYDKISNALDSVVKTLYDKLKETSELSSVKLDKCVVQYDTVKSSIKSEPQYQMLDEANSLSKFDQEFRVQNGSGSNISKSARDIQGSQFGRVCPYTTPESKKVGISLSLSLLSDIDDYGFITMPVRPFSNGKLGDTVYLSPIDEYCCVIAPYGKELESIFAKSPDSVIDECRINGTILAVPVKDIDYQEISPIQDIGPLLSTIPAASCNAGKRLIMAVNAQKQAIPTWRRERPLVTTGVEKQCDIGIVRARKLIESQLFGSSEAIPEDTCLLVENITQIPTGLSVQFSVKGIQSIPNFTYNIRTLNATIKTSLKHTRIHSPKTRYEGKWCYGLNDIVFYENDVDCKPYQIHDDDFSSDLSTHGVALGNNVCVLFKSHEGFGYEDSIIVNEDFVSRFGLSILTTKALKFDLHKNEEVGWHDSVGEISHINKATGLPLIGAYLKPGQDLYTLKKTSQGGEAHYVRVKMSLVDSGYVVSADIKDRTVTIVLADSLHLSPGDKLEGLHGNKGVIGKIVPAREMPFDEDGCVADMILNPMGVVARANLGQEHEFILGAIAHKTGELMLLPAFDAINVENLLNRARSLGLIEKDIYDGRTGRKFDKKGIMGYMHMLRLEHTHTSKYNAAGDISSADKINAKTMQPTSGKGGGQKISEMCSWCFSSYGSDTTLETLFSVQSDSIESKRQLDLAVEKGTDTDIPFKSINIEFLNAYFRSLGITIASVGDTLRVEPLTESFMAKIGPGLCNIDLLKNPNNNIISVIHDPDVLGNLTRNHSILNQYARLDLECEVIMPLFLTSKNVSDMFRYVDAPDSNVVKFASTTLFKDILAGERCICDPSDYAEMYVGEDVQLALARDYSIKINSYYKLPVIMSTSEFVQNYPDADVASHSGIEAFVTLFRNYDAYAAFAFPNTSSRKVDWSQSSIAAVDKSFPNTLAFLKNYNLSDLIVSHILIAPRSFRPTRFDEKTNKDEAATPLDKHLSSITRAVFSLRTAKQRGTDNLHTQVRYVYDAIVKMLDSKDKNVPSLVTELSDHSDKHAIMRDYLGSKRIAYSGRSVISPNPNLHLGEIGIPIAMLCTIFERVIVAKLVHDKLKYSNFNSLLDDSSVMKSAKRLLSCIGNNNHNGFVEIWGRSRLSHDTQNGQSSEASFNLCNAELLAVLEEILAEHPVLANREPSLHKFAIQGFKAIPVNSMSIQLNPLNCKAYNGDFDGDQMAVYFPMHAYAIKDIRAKMMSNDNLIDPGSCASIVALNQDLILGLYYCTIHAKNAEHGAATPKAIYKLGTEYSFNYSDFIPDSCMDIWNDIVSGALKIHDVIMVSYEGRCYLAEAGRIIFNAMIPDMRGFSKLPDCDFSRSVADFTDNDQLRLLQSFKLEYAGYEQSLVLDSSSLFRTDSYAALCNKLSRKYGAHTIYKLFADFVISSKTVNKVVNAVIDYFKRHNFSSDANQDTLAHFYDRVKSLAFYICDISGITLSLYDFERLPITDIISSNIAKYSDVVNKIKEKYTEGHFTEEERAEISNTLWEQLRRIAKSDVEKQFEKYDGKFDRYDNIFMIVDSGARGSIAQLLDTAGFIGVVRGSSDNLLEQPILSNYLNGLTITDGMLNSYTARKQVMSAQLSTAVVGEHTRHLVYLAEHAHISSSSKPCDAKPVCIPLKYTASFTYKGETYASQSSLGSLTLCTDMTSIDDSVWEDKLLEDCICQTTHTICSLSEHKQYYAEICSLMKEKKTTSLDDFLALAAETNCSVAVIHDGDKDVVVQLNFKMTSECRSKIMYRTCRIDSNDYFLYRTLLKSSAHVIEVPDDLADYPVVGKEMIKVMEECHLLSIYIYLMLNCTCTDGICKRCYGIKYDTSRYPDCNEYVGYQGVQSIGGPLSQLVLDSHKRENCSSDDLSILKRLDEVLGGKSGAKDGFEVWENYLSCFKDANVLARNCEILSYVQSSFGIADETKGDILKGECYPKGMLQSANIKFTPTVVGFDDALTKGKRVLTKIMYKEFKNAASLACISASENVTDSHISDILVGKLHSQDNFEHCMSITELEDYVKPVISSVSLPQSGSQASDNDTVYVPESGTETAVVHKAEPQPSDAVAPHSVVILAEPDDMVTHAEQNLPEGTKTNLFGG